MDIIKDLVKPLFHPSIDNISVESLLHALSDPVRVAIFTRITSAECSATCSTFQNITEHPIPKSTLSQHFKVLREAGLIRAERKGIEMHNTSRCFEIESRFPGLIASIIQAYTLQSQKAKKGSASRSGAAKVR